EQRIGVLKADRDDTFVRSGCPRVAQWTWDSLQRNPFGALDAVFFLDSHLRDGLDAAVEPCDGVVESSLVLAPFGVRQEVEHMVTTRRRCLSKLAEMLRKPGSSSEDAVASRRAEHGTQIVR